MSEDRHYVDAITAERLIRGARGGSPVGSDLLANLLEAATSPPGRDELAGEEAAVTAFRAARLASTPESRSKPMLKTALAKLATAKIAIVLAAVGGGAAFAAGSGHLPGAGTTHHHVSGRPTGGMSGSAQASGGHGSPNAAAHSSAAAPGSVAAAGRPASPKGLPSPNLRGLCTAFNAGVGDNPGKALDNPAFTVLITAAGGRDKAAAYCSALLATPVAAAPSQASGREHPKPDTRTTHPTGPATRPSHADPQPTIPRSH